MTTALLLLALQVAQPAQTAAQKPTLICRESSEETGSHIRSGRRCKTAEQWQREDADRTKTPTTMRVTEGQGDALTKQRPQ
jgi:hypothetical protein